MTDKAYETAAQMRKRLKAQIESLQAELRRVEGWLEMWAEFNEEKSSSDFPRLGISGPSAAVQHLRALGGEALLAEVRKLLLDYGRPLTRGPLVSALEERGWTIAGEDKPRNMGTVMWRARDEFVNIEGEGYWPRTVPCPAVGYDPKDANSKEAIAHTLDLDRKDDPLDF